MDDSLFDDYTSIKDYTWRMNDTAVLKSLLKQCVFYLTKAYIDCGFLHNNLELHNVLFKRTKKKAVIYNDLCVDTYGYKVVIIDFEKSSIGVDGIQYFWDNMLSLFSRIDDLNGCIIPVNNFEIISFFKHLQAFKKPCNKSN